MGIFFKRIPIYNRAPVALNVKFDGQDEIIPPGKFDLPEQTVLHAQNQNPIMGTQDPNNPNWDGCQYLIAAEGEAGYEVPLTKEQWETHLSRPCRIDEEAAFAERYGNDPKAKLVLMGKGKKIPAGNRYEAGGNPGGNADFTRKQ